VDDIRFFSGAPEDVSVGSRNAIYLIKRICGDENFMHTGFSQINVTFFLQNKKIIKLNVHHLIGVGVYYFINPDM
jgi:hypothetical protein